MATSTGFNGARDRRRTWKLFGDASVNPGATAIVPRDRRRTRKLLGELNQSR